MRLLFLISSFWGANTGIGGHYYSFMTTADALAAAGHEVVPVLVGNQRSPLLDGWGRCCEFVPFALHQPGRTMARLKEIANELEADCIHGFDADAAFFARFVARDRGIAHAFTICGGPPRRPALRYRNVVVFSEELRRYHEAFGREPLNLKLIANRVEPFDCSPERIAAARGHLREGALTILRICRIGDFHRRSAEQTLRLAQFLRAEGVDAQALIVGEVSEPQVLGELKRMGGDTDVILTDPAMARNAKALIDIADFVVGAGRSYMEGASRGKVMFCANAQYELPALVTPETFADAFSHNFSARVQLPISQEELAAAIVRAAQDEPYAATLRGFHKRTFEEEFSVAAVPRRYEAFYDELVPDASQHPLGRPVEAWRFAKTRLRWDLKQNFGIDLSRLKLTPTRERAGARSSTVL